MAERKASNKKRSEPPTALETERMQREAHDQRESFLQTFFRKGVQFTDEMLRDNERLRAQLRDLEQENMQLRTQLASSAAIQDLLRKVEELERDKQRLLSSISEAEANSSRVFGRQSEMEEELHMLANLYVASYQLHSTLSLRRVFGHLRELLAQLIGARAHAIYLHDPTKDALFAVASDGAQATPKVTVLQTRIETDAVLLTIERVFLTGVAVFKDGPDSDSPVAACVPMRFDDRVVGVIVVYTLLEQKPGLFPVDYELFKMLGAHAATALMGALLYRHAEGELPGLETLLTLAGETT